MAPTQVATGLTTGTVTSRTAAVTSATAPGDTLIAQVAINNTTTTISTLTDSKGNLYTLDRSFITTSPAVYYFRSPGATGGPTGGPTVALTTSDTLTATSAAVAGAVTIQLIDVPGVLAVDQISAVAATTSGAPAVSATPTTNGQLCLVLEVNANAGGVPSLGAPFVSVATYSPGTNQISTAADNQLAVGTGAGVAQNFTATIVSAGWRAVMYTFPAGATIASASMAASVTARMNVGGLKTGFASFKPKVTALLAGSATHPVTRSPVLSAKLIASLGTGTYTAQANIPLYVDTVPPASTQPPLPLYPPPIPKQFVITRRRMPRVMAMDIPTGNWLHRNVPNVTQPVITHVLNGSDSFTCTITPVRPDLLDASGNPIFGLWQTAVFLDQDQDIKFGGILTQADFQGAVWTLTFTGYTGYATGIPYMDTYSKTDYPALKVVQDLWDYIQARLNGNIHLDVDRSGLAQSALVGTQVIPTVVTVRDKKTHKVTTKTVNQKQPFKLDWWNTTDIGSEIAQLASLAPFDWIEDHNWVDSTQQAVTHTMRIGCPRLGTRLNHLRFVEGENVIAPVDVTWNNAASVNSTGGTSSGSFSNEVYALGSGQGSKMLRKYKYDYSSTALRRPITFTNGTITNENKLERLAEQILASTSQTDYVNTLQVRDHGNARFGTFNVGDDIKIKLTYGWRAGLTVWSRILQIQQDPTTSILTLTCARSDSFTYIASSGTAGSL